jgi:glutamate-1-semialdehyde 2,1-aminomutase
VKPDLVVYGKAVANGFPLAAVAARRVYGLHHRSRSGAPPFVAGTYNGHPVAVAAAIETVRYLIANKDTLYPRMEAMGAAMEAASSISSPAGDHRRLCDAPGIGLFPSI